MPNARGGSKRKGKSGRSARKARSGAAVTGLTVTPPIFPARFRGRLFYDGNFTLSVAASSALFNVFRANSVFDPDFTGVGTTAAGYGQLASLYSRYRVMGLKATVSFVNNGAGAANCIMVANGLNTIGIGIAQILAQRFVWQAPMGGSSGMNVHKHTVSFPISKILGVPESQVRDEDDYAALTGGTVNNPAFLHVGVHNTSASVISVTINVRIEYSTVWSFPIDMPQ